MRKLIAFIIVCFALTAPFKGYPSTPDLFGLPKMDPLLEWKVLETANFEIHYHKEVAYLAPKVAHDCEKFHKLLTKTINWIPEDKTVIVIYDFTDRHNGMATVIPYNYILIYPVAPALSSSINESGDWIEETIIHEYTHIINLSQRGSFWNILHPIFGTIVAPNTFLPLWILEGMAVYYETKMTSYGRGRSTYYNMIIRQAVYEKLLDDPSFITLDQINYYVDRWPGGMTRYLFGYLFFEHLASSYGEDFIPRLGLENGSSIPWAINRTIKKMTGKTYYDIWKNILKRKNRRYNPIINKIKKKGLTKPKIITDRGGKFSALRYSPGGNHLVYKEMNYDDVNDLIYRDLKSNEEKHLLECKDCEVASFSPDGNKIFYSKIHRVNKFYDFMDIYHYNLTSKKEENLTQGLRARDPDVSPTGDEIVFVKNVFGNNSLCFKKLAKKDITCPVELKNNERISTPRFSPNGKAIVFTTRDLFGNQDMFLFNREKKTLKRLINSKTNETNPTWSPKGDFIVFSSDKDKVYNIYAYNLSNKIIFQLTNVIGGAFQPSIRPDGKKLAYVQYRSKGFDLAEIDIDLYREDVSKKPVILEKPSAQKSKTEKNSDVPAHKIKSYSSTSHLAPKFWIPFFMFVYDGVYVGGYTTGWDVLMKHTYGAEIAYDSRAKKPSFSLSYTNQQIGQWQITPAFSNIYYYYPQVDDTKNSLIFELYVSRNLDDSKHWKLSFGYQLKRTSFLDFTGIMSGPGIRIKYSNRSKDIGAISWESGRYALLDYTQYFSKTGDYTAFVLKANYKEYFSMPFGKHHVLAFNGAGAFTEGAPLAMHFFSAGGEYGFSYLREFLLIRGYPYNNWWARRALILNSEYRFPIININRGLGTLPIYFRRIHGALLTDIGSFATRYQFSNIYTGVGSEIRLDTVVAYAIPFTGRLGVYQGLNKDIGGDFVFFIGISSIF